MRFLSVINEPVVIQRILGHLGLLGLVCPTYVRLGSTGVVKDVLILESRLGWLRARRSPSGAANIGASEAPFGPLRTFTPGRNRGTFPITST